MAAAPPKARLLVVDDALDTREVIRRNLETQGYVVFTANNVEAARRFLETSEVHLVITDLKMPGASGLDLVRYVREHLPGTEVVMITGYPSVESAVQALKDGAEDYLAKPFTRAELLATVERALGKAQAQSPAPDARGKSLGIDLIGESHAMRAVKEEILKASLTTIPVLIAGESGTGKERTARAIHYGSSRAAWPFVSVDCRAIPPERIGRELFGTSDDASGDPPLGAGFFQLAGQGTLFLREVGALPMPIQFRLLNLLQQSQAASGVPLPSNQMEARILASTSRDLVAMADRGLFQAELLRILSGIRIFLPPLRERGEDLQILTRYFVNKHAQDHGLGSRMISNRALDSLRSCPWPGNVHELEAAVERAVLRSRGEWVDLADLPAPAQPPALQRTLAAMETEYIQAVLAGVGGNKSRAAAILGIDRKTLRKRLQPTDESPNPHDPSDNFNPD